MAQPNTTETNSGNEALSPADVREQFQELTEYQADAGSDKSPLAELLTPAARAAVIDVLLGRTSPVTAREICEAAGIDRATFSRHEDALLATGVVHRPKKVGNAWTYALDRRHPVAQLLIMADTVLRHGVTPDLFGEQFVGQPGEEKDSDA